MVKVRAVVATTEVDMKGERFSEECLKRMEEADTPLPVTMNFGQEEMGKVTNLRYHENGKLVAEIELSRLAVVPGIILDLTDIVMGDGVLTFNSFRTLSFGLVAEPADPNCRILGSDDKIEDIVGESLGEDGQP